MEIITKGLLFLFLLTDIGVIFGVTAAEEIQCSRYHYEEQILSKVVKMESRLELVEKELEELKLKTVTSPGPTSCDDEWMLFKSSCYYFASFSSNFADAENFCKGLGGHLVSIRNAMENDFIKRQAIALSASNFWIGMNDFAIENEWRWTDTNDEVAFKDWKAGEPNGGRTENCIGIHSNYSYKWYDVSCSNQMHPICKTKPLK